MPDFSVTLYHFTRIFYRSGKKRQVSVYKTKKMVDTMKENLTSLKFSPKSKEVLADLFRYYPPGEEGFKQKLSECTQNTQRAQRRRDDSFLKPLMNKSEISHQYLI